MYYLNVFLYFDRFCWKLIKKYFSFLFLLTSVNFWWKFKKKKTKKKIKFNLFCMSFNSIALQLHVYVTQFFLLP